MNTREVEEKERLRKENSKKAVALAMQRRWEEAAALNRSILTEFPHDLEAWNRLGKALSESGLNREAKEAFQHALQISPHNSIARKNLERLDRLGDETPRAGGWSNASPHMFIEESSKAGITSLISLAASKVLLKLAPGHPLELHIGASGLRVTEPSGEYVGQVEPRLGSRLTRLLKGGNQYEAAVTSVGGQELTIIIRETYQDPSQAGTVSFPSRGTSDYHVYVPSAMLGYDAAEGDSEEAEPAAVKDWSSDDTEPGDDDAYTPVVHRIINTSEEGGEEQEEEI